MKCLSIISAVLASIFVHGVLSSSLRDGTSETEHVDWTLDSLRAHAQKYLDRVAPIKTGAETMATLWSPNHQKKRSLANGQPKCPYSFLKTAKKTPVYALCQFSSDPVAPIKCIFVTCECPPVAYFIGTQTSFEELAVAVSGNLIYAPDDGVEPNYYIISQVSGVTTGGPADFAITSTHTSPSGKNLCGADKIKYLKFNVKESDSTSFFAIVTFK